MPPSISVKTPTHHSRPASAVLARRLLGDALGFRACSAATLDAMVAGGTFRTMGKGELLTGRGSRFDNLCIVVQGSLETSLIRHDGHRHLISFLQAGDTAGMIGLIDGLGHVNDLLAREARTTVLLVPGDQVRQLRAPDPALGRAFEMQKAFRSRLLYERLAADPSVPLESRIASLLTTLAALYGVKRADGVLVSMKISQADLADWLGVSRQSINLSMQQLRAEKLIQAQYSTITITDPQRLAARVVY